MGVPVLAIIMILPPPAQMWPWVNMQGSRAAGTLLVRRDEDRLTSKLDMKISLFGIAATIL